MSTELLGINNTGEIAGGSDYSFIYDNGTFTNLSLVIPPGGGITGGINDAGEVVGLYSDNAGTHGFLLNNGTVTAINDPNATSSPQNPGTATEAYGLNNLGQIVGIYGKFALNGGHWNGFLYASGVYTTVTDPSAFVNDGTSSPGTIAGGGTFPTAINDSGQIVGYYFNSAGTYFGFIDNSGSFSAVAVPGALDAGQGTGTLVHGINNAGEMVGYYWDTSRNQHGFLDIGGTYTTIDFPGASLTGLTGINNAGDLVGFYASNGVLHGFEATPDSVGPEGYSFVTIDAPEPPPCFLKGTHIATSWGEVPIENLRVGDMVRSHPSGLSPIKWIGCREVRLRLRDDNDSHPICIRSDAFGDGRPCRDLYLSPDHAVFVDGALIPIRLLVNGTTIARQYLRSAYYYHIELDEHELLLAEGLLCESYLDARDRAGFRSDYNTFRLFDGLVPRESVSTSWETRGCAALLLRGNRLEAARESLRAAGVRRLRASPRDQNCPSPAP